MPAQLAYDRNLRPAANHRRPFWGPTLVATIGCAAVLIKVDRLHSLQKRWTPDRAI